MLRRSGERMAHARQQIAGLVSVGAERRAHPAAQAGPPRGRQQRLIEVGRKWIAVLQVAPRARPRPYDHLPKRPQRLLVGNLGPGTPPLDGPIERGVEPAPSLPREPRVTLAE